MAEPNKSNIRETHSPKADAKLRLAQSSVISSSVAPPDLALMPNTDPSRGEKDPEGNASRPPVVPGAHSVSGDSSLTTERSRLEDIKASGGVRRSRPPVPVGAQSVSVGDFSSSTTERSRLEGIKASASGGEPARGVRGSRPPTTVVGVRSVSSSVDSSAASNTTSRLEAIKASASAGEKGPASRPPATVVGAESVSGESSSVPSRPRRTKEKQQQQRGSGFQNKETADEEAGLLNVEDKDKPEGNETLLEAEVAPDVEALVQQRLEEERQNQQDNATRGNDNGNNVLVAMAEAFEEETDNGSKWKKVLMLVIVFVAGVIAAVLLSNKDDAVPVTLAPAPAVATPQPTLAPTTLMPTLPRLEQIQTSLADKIGGSDDFGADETLVWLVKTDIWSPPNTAASDPDSLWKERYSMAKIYFSTNGAEWTFGNSWLSPNSVCDWGCCDPSFEVVKCDDSGRVVSLNLEQKELEGSLPIDVFDGLTAMTSLAINDNRLSGSFPRFPPNLEFVGIYANIFSGSISPDFFTGLTKLASLGMSNNVLTGMLPPLPPNVESCWLNNNRFSGTVSTDFFITFIKLTHMTLTNNQLSGSLPLLPPNLVRGWLNNNDFSGTLAADYFTGLTALTHIALGDNRLSGSIPPLPANIMSSKLCWFDGNCLTNVSNGQVCGTSRNGDCNTASPTIASSPSSTEASSSVPTYTSTPVPTISSTLAPVVAVLNPAPTIVPTPSPMIASSLSPTLALSPSPSTVDGAL